MYCNSLCSQQGRITSDRNDEQRAKNRLYGMRWREKNKHKRELYRANKILNKNKKPTIKLNESQSRLAFAKLDVGDTKIFDLPIGVQK